MASRRTAGRAAPFVWQAARARRSRQAGEALRNERRVETRESCRALAANSASSHFGGRERTRKTRRHGAAAEALGPDARQPGSGVRAAARSERAFQGVCLQRVEIQGHPGCGGTRPGTRGTDAWTRLRGGVETRPRDGRSDTPGTERTAADRNAARPERSPATRFAIRQAKPYSWPTRVHRKGGPGQRQKETIP